MNNFLAFTIIGLQIIIWNSHNEIVYSQKNQDFKLENIINYLPKTDSIFILYRGENKNDMSLFKIPYTVLPTEYFQPPDMIFKKIFSNVDTCFKEWDSLPDGEWTQFKIRNGVARPFLIKNIRNNLYNGEQVFFHPNGSLSCSTKYLNGHPYGKSIAYNHLGKIIGIDSIPDTCRQYNYLNLFHLNGRIRARLNFVNETITEYYENGITSSIGKIDKIGNRQGKFINYDSKGYFQSTEFWKDNKIIK